MFKWVFTFQSSLQSKPCWVSISSATSESKSWCEFKWTGDKEQVRVHTFSRLLTSHLHLSDTLTRMTCCEVQSTIGTTVFNTPLPSAFSLQCQPVPLFALHMLAWNRLLGPVKKLQSRGWSQMVDQSSTNSRPAWVGVKIVNLQLTMVRMRTCSCWLVEE